MNVFRNSNTLIGTRRKYVTESHVCTRYTLFKMLVVTPHLNVLNKNYLKHYIGPCIQVSEVRGKRGWIYHC